MSESEFAPIKTSEGTGLVVSIDELRRQIRVTTDYHDVDLIELHNSAVELYEQRLSRAFLTSTWTWTIPDFDHDNIGNYQLEIPRAPLVSLDEIAYYDGDNAEQTLDSTWIANNVDVFTDRHTLGRIRPKPGSEWPSVYDRPNAITLTFTAGYGTSYTDMPALVKQLIKVTVATWFDYRTSQIDGTFVATVPDMIAPLVGQLLPGSYAGARAKT